MDIGRKSFLSVTFVSILGNFLLYMLRNKIKLTIPAIVQLGPSPSLKNKTLVLDKSRTLKSPSNHHPPKTFKEVPGNVGFQIFAWAPKKK